MAGTLAPAVAYAPSRGPRSRSAPRRRLPLARLDRARAGRRGTRVAADVVGGRGPRRPPLAPRPAAPRARRHGRHRARPPVRGVDFGFSVKGTHTLWWGGCVWDSFAIPNLVPGEPSVLVATTCPSCGRPHAWTVTDEAPPEGDQVAHFLVPVTRIWDDVLFTCGNQRVFCDDGLPRPVARPRGARARLCDGSRHRLAAREGLVRRAARRGLPAPRAGRGRGVLPVGRVAWAVLGAAGRGLSVRCLAAAQPRRVSRRPAPRAPRPPARRRRPRRAAR